MGRLEERILNLLEERPAMRTREISETLRLNYATVYNCLLRMKDKGMVQDVRVKSYYWDKITYIKCRYWFLPKNRAKVMRWLKSNSHISVLKKPKSWSDFRKQEGW